MDAQGYTPSTDPRAALQTALGAPVAKSADGVFTAYKLPAGTADQAARSQLLEPVIVALDAYGIERDGPQDAIGQWIGPDVTLRLANLGHDAVPVTVTMAVAPEGDVDRVLTLVDEQGKEVARKDLRAGTSTPVTFLLTAPEGTTRLQMKISGDPVRRTESPDRGVGPGQRPQGDDDRRRPGGVDAGTGGDGHRGSVTPQAAVRVTAGSGRNKAPGETSESPAPGCSTTEGGGRPEVHGRERRERTQAL